MFWILFWAAKHDAGSPVGPVLENGTRTVARADGRPGSRALDQFMPKNQAVIAQKAA